MQIKPQEERERSLPVGKLIRIWEIMFQITAFFGDLPHNLRQNTLDSIQPLHHRDYGKLRWLQMMYALNRGVDKGPQDCQTKSLDTDKCGVSGKYLYEVA